VYPPPLKDIIDLCSGLPESERREMLISFADGASRQAPQEGESFDLEDIRKDEECTDTVGVFLRVDPTHGCLFRISLGPQVQTLTRAMTTILCRGFHGASPQQIVDAPADFVPLIIGADLVRLRSQTVYYVLSRMKAAAKVWLNRQRAAAAESSTNP
jgi:cysteine desulfuration protein SufE